MNKLANKATKTCMLLGVACCLTLTSWAQGTGKLMKQGNKKFEKEDYRAAIPFYEKVLSQEPDNAMAMYRAGISYMSFNKEKAIDYVQRAVKMKPNVSSDTEYWLGRVNHINYNFDEAISHYRNADAKLKRNDERHDEIAVRIRHSNQAKQQFNAPKDIFVKNLGPKINSAYSDHSPVISSDDNYLLFTSRRQDATGKETQEGEYFEDIFEARRVDDAGQQSEGGEWQQPRSLSGALNGKGHDASIQLYDNDTKMLLYRQDDNGDIFYSEKGSGDWTEPKKLGKNVNTKAFESDAFITQDGQTLYFSSSKYSENGDLDIMVSKKEGNDWGKPQPISANINTGDDDDSPYLSKDGQTLYFASRGHNTMGGYDIFRSKRVGNGWGKPENMGYPVNTPDDDTYYRLSPDGRYAYLSSYRVDGYGEKDIYTINYITNLRVYGQVRSAKDSTLVPGVEITFSGTAANKKAITVKDVTKPDNGNYEVSMLSGRKYQITLTRDGQTVLTDEIELPIVTDDTTRIRKDFVLPYTPSAEDTMARFAFRKIYFDTDMHDLRPESVTELNNVLKILRQFPDATLYVDGHTDSRQTDAYNQRLSNRRSNAAYDYLIQNGIDKKRLTKRGFGEKKPVAPNDSPENMQLNRRTEFNVKTMPANVNPDGSMKSTNTGGGNTGTTGTGTAKPGTTGTGSKTGTGSMQNNLNNTGGEMKIKSGDMKYKSEPGKTKMETGDTKMKQDGDKTKYESGKTEIKMKDGEMKMKDGNTKIKVEQKKP